MATRIKAALDVGNSSIKLARKSGGVTQVSAVFRKAESFCVPSKSSPIVGTPGKTPLQWGKAALTSHHTALHQVCKEDYALEALVAAIGPGTHNLNLQVSHYDMDTARAMATSLSGNHTAEIDTGMGTEQCTLDIQANPAREGTGCYQLMAGQLGPNAVIVEMGARTCELVVFQDGELVTYLPESSLGVLSVLSGLAKGGALDAYRSNLTEVEDLVKSGQFSDIPALKQALKDWYAALTGHFKTKLTTGVKYKFCLCGGGAELVQQYLPNTAATFTIPSDPQTASVRGLVL